MEPERWLGTMFLMMVLPCAIILFFCVQKCCAKYWKPDDEDTDTDDDNDDQVLEAFRVQIQERRLQGGHIPESPRNQDKINHVNNLSDVFYFHTIHPHDDTSIPWQIEKATDKTENKGKSSTAEDTTISTTSDDDYTSSSNYYTAAADPDGFKQDEDESSKDDLDLEECIDPAPKMKSSNQSSFNTIRDRIFGGTSYGSSSTMMLETKKKQKSKKNHPSLPLESPTQSNNYTSYSRKGEGVVGDEECCCICLEGYATGQIICTPKQKNCNHMFHKECLFGWIKQNHDCCPLCRVNLIE